MYPYDKIVVAGSDKEIQRLIQTIEERNQLLQTEEPVHHISLIQYQVMADSHMIGKSIMELSIQEKTESMIIGIDKPNQTIISISPDYIFEEGDILLLAGEKDKLDTFEENLMFN